MARSAKKGGWPEKNPETGAFGEMDTPLSTTAAGPDPRPGYNATVPTGINPSNPMGFSGLEGGKGRKKGRK